MNQKTPTEHLCLDHTSQMTHNGSSVYKQQQKVPFYHDLLKDSVLSEFFVHCEHGGTPPVQWFSEVGAGHATCVSDSVYKKWEYNIYSKVNWTIKIYL